MKKHFLKIIGAGMVIAVLVFLATQTPSAQTPSCKPNETVCGTDCCTNGQVCLSTDEGPKCCSQNAYICNDGCCPKGHSCTADDGCCPKGHECGPKCCSPGQRCRDGKCVPEEPSPSQQ